MQVFEGECQVSAISWTKLFSNKRASRGDGAIASIPAKYEKYTMLSAEFPSYPNHRAKVGRSVLRHVCFRIYSDCYGSLSAAAAASAVVLDCASQSKFLANAFPFLRTGLVRVAGKEDDDPETMTTSSRERGTGRRVVDIEKGSIND